MTSCISVFKLGFSYSVLRSQIRNLEVYRLTSAALSFQVLSCRSCVSGVDRSSLISHTNTLCGLWPAPPQTLPWVPVDIEGSYSSKSPMTTPRVISQLPHASLHASNRAVQHGYAATFLKPRQLQNITDHLVISWHLENVVIIYLS